MRFGILASPESWYLQDLRRAAAAADNMEIVSLSFMELQAAVESSGPSRVLCGDIALDSLDALLVRTMPPGSLEQVVFRMDLLGRYEAAGGVVLNPPRAIEAAVDKYLTTAKLAAAGLPSPKTYICQTAAQGMVAFEKLNGDIVLKPLFGSEGRGIARLHDAALALRAMKLFEQLGSILYIQEYIAHAGYDCRIFVCGKQWYSMKRSNPLDWRTNVSRGATTTPYQPTEEMVSLAQRAAECVGAPVAGVDLLPGKNGTWYVLEVNAVPGWKALASTLQVDIAAEVLRFTQTMVEHRHGGRS